MSRKAIITIILFIVNATIHYLEFDADQSRTLSSHSSVTASSKDEEQHTEETVPSISEARPLIPKHVTNDSRAVRLDIKEDDDEAADVDSNDGTLSRLLVGDPKRYMYESMKETKPNQSLFGKVGEDITARILSNLCNFSLHILSLTSRQMKDLITRKCEDRMRFIQRFIDRMQNTDTVHRELYEYQHCCLDNALLKKRLSEIPCYLSKWNGSEATLHNLFSNRVLSKMKNESKFRIIRGFDDETKTIYFAVYVVNGNACVERPHLHPYQYFVFVFSPDEFEGAFCADDINQVLTQMNYPDRQKEVQCIGDLMLDDKWYGHVIFATRERCVMKKGVRCMTARHVVIVVVTGPIPWIIEEGIRDAYLCLLIQVFVALMSLVFMIAFCSPSHPNGRMGFFVTFVLLVAQLFWFHFK